MTKKEIADRLRQIADDVEDGVYQTAEMHSDNLFANTEDGLKLLWIGMVHNLCVKY